MQIPQDLHITFNPSILLEVTLPQKNGPAVPIKAGEHIQRNGIADASRLIERSNSLLPLQRLSGHLASQCEAI